MEKREKTIRIVQKAAAALALFIGLMSIFAGSRVLLGMETKTYHVLNWLLIYNVAMGFVSLFAAYLMWKTDYRANNMISMILFAHLAVELLLRFFIESAAEESKKAMLFRIVVWLVIMILYVQVPVICLKNPKPEK